MIIRFSCAIFLCGVVTLLPAYGVEVERQALSPRGYATATVSVKDVAAAWVAESSDCKKTEKFAAAAKVPEGFSLVIEADKLASGVNQLFLCTEKEAGVSPVSRAFEITRNDDSPKISFEPPPGETAVMPEIKLRSDAGAQVAYTANGADPSFTSDGRISLGERYSQAFRPVGGSAQIKARAISAAGVVSEIFTAEYRENARLRGLNGLDMYAGGLFISTTSSVKQYLPSGVGGVLGVRYGLDSVFVPSQSDIRARSFYLPAVWGELNFLNLDHAPYKESLFGFMLGPEWQLPLNESRSLLFIVAVGVGASQVSVTTPTYSGSGITTLAAAKSGIEYHLGAWAIFAQARYMYVADQNSPLTGIGASAGVYWKL